jgi:flagellin
MANDISLSASVRENLLSLNNTESLIQRTERRLSTGLKISSPIDDARIFFEAKALSDRAEDMEGKRESIDQSISSVSAALEAIEAIDSIVKQMKGLAISAKSASGSEFTSLKAQYDELRGQINNLANDATYQGLNLVNSTASSLLVSFSTLTSSSISITGVDMQASALSISVFSAAIGGSTETVAGITIDSAINQLDAAISTLRGSASTIGSNVSLLQTRLDFTEKYVNVQEEGAAKLTLADITEEGANLVALQTRQQLGISSLAFAGQSEQSVLSLFN